MTTSPNAAHPTDFARLRSEEFAQLDRDGHVYVDYTGGALHARSQIERHTAMLAEGPFGNPHSLSPASARSTEHMERAKARVYRWFNADPDEWEVVFTANASHAIKLVAEAYPFVQDGRFLLTFDNHNSINGIREFARAHGSHVTYSPLTPLLELDVSQLRTELANCPAPGHCLFAFPAQSNFSGVRHDLSIIVEAKAAGWDVLLDAAAFAPTSRLDLSACKPDFVCLSFYKMFGYPTGIGALVARRDAMARLRRPWFAGGTIALASVQANRHIFAHGGAAFEDGTPNYLGIAALEYGFDVLEGVGIDALHAHVDTLTARFLDGVQTLQHGDGSPLIRVLGPVEMGSRGGTVAFNLFRKDGSRVAHQDVERDAADEQISLRTGCFCNPGAGETALRLSQPEIEGCFPAQRLEDVMAHFRTCIDPNKGTGAVRVSFGLATNEADVDRVIVLLRRWLEP